MYGSGLPVVSPRSGTSDWFAKLDSRRNSSAIVLIDGLIVPVDVVGSIIQSPMLRVLVCKSYVDKS